MPCRCTAEKPFSGGVFVHSDREGDGDPNARLFWEVDLDPSIVSIEAEPVSPKHPDAFDIARFGTMADLIMDSYGSEMLLLDDGTHQIQLNVTVGTLSQGPVCLRFDTAGFSHLDSKLRTLARLDSLQRRGCFSRSLFAPDANAPKWSRALQALDGVADGASQREIACVLFGEKAVREEWGGRSEFLKSRTQRLIKYGKEMVDGGYRKLLT